MFLVFQDSQANVPKYQWKKSPISSYSTGFDFKRKHVTTNQGSAADQVKSTCILRLDNVKALKQMREILLQTENSNCAICAKSAARCGAANDQNNIHRRWRGHLLWLTTASALTHFTKKALLLTGRSLLEYTSSMIQGCKKARWLEICHSSVHFPYWQITS